MKTIHLPYLETKIEALTEFEQAYQRIALEVRAQAGQLNQEVDLAQFYFQKTFDSSIRGQNHENICKNLENAYRNIASKARYIVDLIAKMPAA